MPRLQRQPRKSTLSALFLFPKNTPLINGVSRDGRSMRPPPPGRLKVERHSRCNGKSAELL